MFTPIETTIGALLLHQATSNLLYQNGDILGASGYLRRLFSAPTKELLAFFTGMAASYVPLKALAPQLITEYPAVQISPQTAVVTVVIGALVGWGTKVRDFLCEDLTALTWTTRCQMDVLRDTCCAVSPD
jgi:uncharacterized membrane protein YedE/YeeE